MNARLRKLLQPVLAADKKKISILLACFAVGMLLWGRLLLKQVARTAGADPQVGAPAASDKTQVTPEVRPVVYVDLPTGIERDIFAMDPSNYEKTESSPPQEEDDGEKSAAAPTDKSLQADEISAALEKFKLEATFGGATPQALISGQMLQLGEDIDGFELIKVSNREVVLRFKGVEVRLEM